ncbi:membrane dipeptidase [Brevibacillus fluminis]|uniref:Membrane dipeptidase n=1 Tax=Brevibacillus fluminis TaxID=511487 RepID=A0A3M8DHV6_9BACL|nr:dipeptidase [Brevibacillus fluminis]RNB87051.1 membrane dipeptidase [Brevibacillus fluminis]
MEKQWEEVAGRIHARALVADAHFDLLMDVEIQRKRGRTRVIESDYLPEFERGGVNVIVAAVFVESEFLPEMGLRKALNQITALHAEVAESPDRFMICRTMQDVERAVAENKLGFVLSLEGVEPIGDDLTLVRTFYELGVRSIGLTWSRRNYAADGSHYSKAKEGKEGGLTAFGVQILEEAARLGITIDVSHINDSGFWDVIAFSEKPVIASHSNARSVTDSSRNLTDEQIKAIAETNGVIGLNAASMFTADTDERSTIAGLVDHAEHIIKLVGVEHVCLGLDLCDPFMKYISPETIARFPRVPFDVVKGHGQLPALTAELLQRGYSESDAEKILGKNLMRVFASVWK